MQLLIYMYAPTLTAYVTDVVEWGMGVGKLGRLNPLKKLCNSDSMKNQLCCALCLGVWLCTGHSLLV